MQPFATKEAAVSNNKHHAFSALDGENLALVQSIQLHEPDFLLSPPCRSLHTLVPVATAQSALKYLLGTLAGSPTRQSCGFHCSPSFILTPGTPGLNVVCHRSTVRMCVRSPWLLGPMQQDQCLLRREQDPGLKETSLQHLQSTRGAQSLLIPLRLLR